MQFPDPFLGFLLEGFRRRGKVRVLIAEQLVRDLTGEEHPNIRMLVDVLADQIHSNAGPDGGDIVSAK